MNMKRLLYSASWLAVVFGISAIDNLATTSFLTFYYGWNFPPFTPHMLLLIWVSETAFCGLVLALVMNSVSSKQTAGGIPAPLPSVIINQAAASAIYVIAGVVLSYNRMLYFLPTYMCYVINEYLPGTVTDANRSIWLLIFTTAHMLIFTATALIFYFSEQNRQTALLKKGLSD